MTTRFLVLDALFLLLAGVSAVAMWEHGYVAIFAAALTSSSHLQLGTDLVVSLTLLTGFIVSDARRRGLNPWPFLVATPLLGSFGPLGYLFWRTWSEREAVSVP